MREDEIKLSVLEPQDSTTSISFAALEATVQNRVLSTGDSTQGEEAFVGADGLRITRSKVSTNNTGVSAHDVAAFILKQQGEMTAMKLQKLVYYSQAWSLVWDDEPLFGEEIEAWANGPVVRALYARHQGQFKVREWNGNPEKLSDTQRETIMKVLEYYGDMPSQVLSDLSHREEPWLKAREGLAPTERGRRVITSAAMAEYYSRL
ncbi:MAG: Panacea domain-containing protein [Pyrinomonadaceae bacterium]